MSVTSRPAMCHRDVLAIIGGAAALSLLVIGAGPAGRYHARQTTCAMNLQRIGQGMHIYSNDNAEWFPHHYYEPHYSPAPSNEHRVRWVGTMGSNPELSITEKTSATVSPMASHPSRALFLLIIGGSANPSHFVCPDSRETPDDMLNYGSDAEGPGTIGLAFPGQNRFDFRGLRHLSYGYQLPYGRWGKPRQGMDVRMALAADRGPFYRSLTKRTPETNTTTDYRSRWSIPDEWHDLSLTEILLMDDEWREFNSPNHQGDGQNIVRVDGSVEFAERPIAGVHYENIYSLARATDDSRDSLIGFVPDPNQTLGPAMDTDSFLVP